MENKSDSLTEEPSISCVLCSENSNSDTLGECSAICTNSGVDQNEKSQSDDFVPCVTKDIKDRRVNSYQGMNSSVHSAEDVFNTFLYWRRPLPDISQDLELLQCTEMHGESCLVSEALCNNCVASSEIKKVLQSLQEHMDDPDVQGKIPALIMFLYTFLLGTCSNFLSGHLVSQDCLI